MALFQIEIQETLRRVVTLESESPALALALVKQRYQQEEIVLDWQDWVDTHIQISHTD